MTSLNDSLQAFIEKQHLFFVATADTDGRVNVSPKGMESLKVLDKNRIVWLNLTGSGNESAAHVQATSRMTLMWCSFDKTPLILRAYGTAKTIYQNDEKWESLIPLFATHLAPRQIFDLTIDTVQTSCGFGVPFFSYEGERNQLDKWANSKGGEEGIKAYWKEKNMVSLDGKPTGMIIPD